MSKKKTAEPIEEKKSNAPEGTYATITVEGKECHLKKPSKATLSKVLPMLTPTNGSEPNLITIGEITLRDCFIGGDVEFLTDDDFTIAGALQAVTLITFKTATIKKH